MMKRALLSVGVCLIALTLSACMSVVQPWVAPIQQPNHAMSRLGIREVHIDHTYRVIIPVDRVFDIRSTEIKEEAYPGLTQLADHLRRFMPECMTVKGYTDSLGSYPEDQWLAEKQARSLIAFLWTQGIPHECLVPLGIGKDEAYTIASNRSVDGSAVNRRIEITFKSRINA